MFNHICLDGKREGEIRGRGISDNKKPIYVNGLAKTMTCNLINQLDK
jgi:hypothetical protein